MLLAVDAFVMEVVAARHLRGLEDAAESTSGDSLYSADESGDGLEMVRKLILICLLICFCSTLLSQHQHFRDQFGDQCANIFGVVGCLPLYLFECCIHEWQDAVEIAGHCCGGSADFSTAWCAYRDSHARRIRTFTLDQDDT